LLIDGDCSVTPTEIREALEKENIESRPIWKPMHLQPVFEGHDFVAVDNNTDVGKDVFERGLCLPSDVKITEEEQERVIDIVKGCFK